MVEIISTFAWAVDETGLPVELDSIHYIKVQTASLTTGVGGIGEKSTEVNAVTRVFGENVPSGLRKIRAFLVNGEEIVLVEGRYVYPAALDNGGTIQVEAGENASVYINNMRANTRTLKTHRTKAWCALLCRKKKRNPSFII